MISVASGLVRNPLKRFTHRGNTTAYSTVEAVEGSPASDSFRMGPE